jgi:hypothetical protein
MQRRYFSGNSARFVSGRILKRKVQITVHFDFRSNYAPRECEPACIALASAGGVEGSFFPEKSHAI